MPALLDVVCSQAVGEHLPYAGRPAFPAVIITMNPVDNTDPTLPRSSVTPSILSTLRYPLQFGQTAEVITLW